MSSARRVWDFLQCLNAHSTDRLLERKRGRKKSERARGGGGRTDGGMKGEGGSAEYGWMERGLEISLEEEELWLAEDGLVSLNPKFHSTPYFMHLSFFLR